VAMLHHFLVAIAKDVVNSCKVLQKKAIKRIYPIGLTVSGVD